MNTTPSLQNSGVYGRDGFNTSGTSAQSFSRRLNFKEMMTTSPAAVASALKVGTFKTDAAVYANAEVKVRAFVGGTARTTGCAGKPGDIFPWAESVLDSELLGRVEPALLSPAALELRGDSPPTVQVTPTRAELNVARTLGLTHEGDDAAVLGALSGVGTPARGTRLRPTPRGARTSSPRPTGPDDPGAEDTDAPRSISRPPAGARAVLDAQGTLKLSESHRSVHEQAGDFLRQAQDHVRGDGAVLWFSDCDPLVGAALVGALEGQIALLYVVRRTLQSLVHLEEVKILLGDLSDPRLDHTVNRYLRRHHPKPAATIPLFDRVLGFVPFGRVALAMVVHLLVTGSSPFEAELLQAVNSVFIAGTASHISIDLGSVIEVSSCIEDAGVDIKGAHEALEAKVAGAGDITFSIVDDSGETLNWASFALTTSKTQLLRRRSGSQPTLAHFNALVDSLSDFHLASARRSDMLRATGRGAAATSSPAFQVTDEPDDASDHLSPIFAVDGARAPATATRCGKCHGQVGPSLLCKPCKLFVSNMWICGKCGMPTAGKESLCRNWMCPGTRGSTPTLPPSSLLLSVFVELFTKRFAAARPDAGGSGGGGRGGRHASE